ncbi:hypothetical protein A3H65_00130 [Candidatus Giovannonibacteria bacterium RIFCSPLOWO2_02_FULL_45_14]|nr:MAG: hypothetical protein A3C75_00675 [Candidatus Giovannonibacteria bacterium RIFCSPHIGHO2_02_FULL_44_31]OGF76228.1 MAG: hypothetical protein A3E62_03795 [Candidatus Giovannonibacteria bacterium RIFCSPHIGHO2_12_FULL_44_29]OGF91125.1 MAG: hypothetical protein A3H65_00130 [Candidatus Giovannonibacteria bacterium RIFCSPLOWO2_02_FULL_45_14]
MIMIWIFAIISILLTPNLASADVPVFDSRNNKVLLDTKQLIDERTEILNQMIAGIFRKEIGITKSGAKEDPAIQEIIASVQSGSATPCEALGNSLDCIASKITEQSMVNLAAQYQARLEGEDENGAAAKEPDGDPINTFTDGKFYVPDYGQYYANVATNEREIFLGSTLGDADPLQVKANLAPYLKDTIPQLVSKSLKSEDFENRVKSTMPENEDDFFATWEALISPQNSPEGVYLSFLDEAQFREQTALAIAQEELNSPGIIPTKDCDYADVNGKKLIGNCIITNPAGQNVAAAGQIPIIDRERASNADELSDIQKVASKPGEGENTFIGPSIMTAGNDATRKNSSLYNVDQLINLAAKIIASIFNGTAKTAPTPTPRVSPTPTPAQRPVMIDSPANGTYANGDVSVSVTSTAPGTVAVQFYVDGVPYGLPVAGTGTFNTTIDTDILTEGPHVITAVALDSNNAQIGTSNPVTIFVDRTPPAISALRTSDSETNIRGNTNITADASDNGNKKLVSVEFFLNGISIGFGNLQMGLHRLIGWDSTSFVNGTYQLIAVATDRAGNTTETTPLAITINN